MRVELKGKAGEMMSHIPFGYTIQNGRAVINEEEAVKIEKLFEAYLSGLSLSEAAKKRALSATTHLLQECWQINGMLRTNSIRQLSARTHSKKHNWKDAGELRRLAGFMNIKEMKRNA
jgi:hypothetical protein